MAKRKLILYLKELPSCTCYGRIFNTEYETIVAYKEEEFFANLQNTPADAAVICCCSAREKDVENVLCLDALAGPLPVLTCSKTLNPEFIRKAAQQGATRFLMCDMRAEKIRDIIHDAIRDDGLKQYLHSCWSSNPVLSPHLSKLIDEIVHVFPHRMQVHEFAGRLGIDRGWLHKLCKRAFGKPPTALLRHVWVHQALRMMQHTNLDNTDIAFQLCYGEESSMARDFQKELGYSPNEARRRLTQQRPEEILFQYPPTFAL